MRSETTREKITAPAIQAMKGGDKIIMVTAYDYPTARVVEAAGLEAILVGDSLGMVLQGHTSTLPVTVEDMAYHTRCVARSAAPALVISDMPFMSYARSEQAMLNAAKLMQAGAQVVKLEGGAWLAETVRLLAERGIPVCAHLGLTPQSVNSFGGFIVQGRDPAAARQILADARTLTEAGASLLVLECVPRSLAAEITAAASIPVIGIGAGGATDAQVLVMHDLLGMNPRPPRFVQNFLTDGRGIAEAFAAYAAAVRDGSFPRPEHGFD